VPTVVPYSSHQFASLCIEGPRRTLFTGLARAGVSAKMAQTLARHSDVRLTLGVYTHVELPACSAAIESLPAPPTPKDQGGEQPKAA
jgi:hypothetical protein